jgi:hypothetical protein
MMQAGMSISDSPLTEPKPVLPMIESLLAPRLRRHRYLGVRTAVILYVRDETSSLRSNAWDSGTLA